MAKWKMTVSQSVTLGFIITGSYVSKKEAIFWFGLVWFCFVWFVPFCFVS